MAEPQCLVPLHIPRRGALGEGRACLGAALELQVGQLRLVRASLDAALSSHQRVRRSRGCAAGPLTHPLLVARRWHVRRRGRSRQLDLWGLPAAAGRLPIEERTRAARGRDPAALTQPSLVARRGRSARRLRGRLRGSCVVAHCNAMYDGSLLRVLNAAGRARRTRRRFLSL